MRNLIDAALEVSVVGSFSRIGYDVRSRLRPWDAYEVAGKRILITGGTSGIGFAAAATAVRNGAEVVITGRDDARTRQAAKRAGAIGIACDVGDLEALPTLVERSVDALGAVDVLVNNAGALDARFTRTAQGFENTYAVHVLAPFLLTALVLPLADTVITVSSGGMYSQRLDPPTMQMTEADYSGVTAYGRAKRVQVALNEQWARHFPDGPTFAAMHPGWADTPGVQRSLPRFRTLTGPILRTPDQGADTILWLAGGHVPSGRFWLDRAPRATTKVPGFGHTEDTATLAWDIVCEQSGAAAYLPAASQGR